MVLVSGHKLQNKVHDTLLWVNASCHCWQIFRQCSCPIVGSDDQIAEATVPLWDWMTEIGRGSCTQHPMGEGIGRGRGRGKGRGTKAARVGRRWFGGDWRERRWRERLPESCHSPAKSHHSLTVHQHTLTHIDSYNIHTTPGQWLNIPRENNFKNF